MANLWVTLSHNCLQLFTELKCVFHCLKFHVAPLKKIKLVSVLKIGLNNVFVLLCLLVCECLQFQTHTYNDSEKSEMQGKEVHDVKDFNLQQL